MNKKQAGAVAITGLVALFLAGCGSNNLSSQGSSSSASLIAEKSSTKISADGMSPQQAVSLVTAYAGNKFGGQWAQVAKQAQRSKLQVNLYPTSRYQLSDNGQGMAYEVTAGGKSTGLVYTINPNDEVVIYRGAQSGQAARKLTTISKPAMARYINHNGQGMLVNRLAENARVIDKSTPGSQSSSSNDTTQPSSKYGNQGPFAIPSNMQGSWYSADGDEDSTLVINDHTMTIDGDTLKLYRQDPKFAQDNINPSEEQSRATKDWGRARYLHDDGGDWLNVQGWFQNAGDGTSYMTKTETVDGKPVKVLVVGEGAENWVTAVYYPTKALAQQHANQKFDDLHYEDDD